MFTTIKEKVINKQVELNMIRFDCPCAPNSEPIDLRANTLNRSVELNQINRT